jgi:hypothetical protein
MKEGIMKYKWNSTGFSANANKVGEELSIIEETKDLTSVNVLQYAKTHKSSELNKCFEWDDSIASEKYRLIQANNILVSISVVVTEEAKEEPLRAFVNVKTKEDKKVFKSIVKVLENDEEYLQLLEKAERDFISYKEKYTKVVKYKDLRKIISKNI